LGKHEDAPGERDARAGGEATTAGSARAHANGAGGPTTRRSARTQAKAAAEAARATVDGRTNARWDGDTDRLSAYGVS